MLSYRNAYPNDSLRRQWAGDEVERLAQERLDDLELRQMLGQVTAADSTPTHGSMYRKGLTGREAASIAWKRGILEANPGFVDPRSFNGRRIAFMQRSKHSVL